MPLSHHFALAQATGNSAKKDDSVEAKTREEEKVVMNSL
jgi:hypothetical protein